MPDEQQLDSSHDDTVNITAKIYKINAADGECISVLVGEHGLYYPKHEDSMHWIPRTLISKISPVHPNGTVTISLPRWLATKKGFSYHE